MKHYEPIVSRYVFIDLLITPVQWDLVLSLCVIRTLGLTVISNDQFCIIQTLWIFYLLLAASLLQAIFFKNPFYVLKKSELNLPLFWGHKSRLAFLLTVVLLKVLWMEFFLVFIEEKCSKIYIPVLKSLRRMTSVLLNTLNIRNL